MDHPAPGICRAFGVSGAPTPLPGGQGQAWRAGRLVLKPIGDEAEHAWVCGIYEAWPDDDTVRVPRPVRAADGEWAYDGWGAHHWVDGSDAPMSSQRECDVIRQAGDAFHAAVSQLPRPHFLDGRHHPWAVGDRVAWEQLDPKGAPVTVGLLDRLLTGAAPIDARAQVIHGDLCSNVLVSPGQPPAVIDWPPYFRPVGWALAIAAVDAVAWKGAPPGLLDRWADVADWEQLLVRALVFRIATQGCLEGLGTAHLSPGEHQARIEPLVHTVLARLG